METIKLKGITFIHGDCMEFLKEQKENAFDLAIVDPPYGINIDKWDKKTDKPKLLYFKFLSFCSKNQIIWGANYFTKEMPFYENWICWDKKPFLKQSAKIELAATSFNIKSNIFHYTYAGNAEGMKKIKVDYNKKRIHPTQKPVQLYKWLLMNYAKEGQIILDTHGGSGSIAIACHQLGFELTIIEKDKEYFDNMLKRFKLETAQQTLF